MTQQAKDKWGDFFRHNVLTMIGMIGSIILMLHYADVYFVKFTDHVSTIDTAISNLHLDVNSVKKDVLILNKKVDKIFLQKHDDSLLRLRRYNYVHVPYHQHLVTEHKTTPTSQPIFIPVQGLK